MQEQYSSSVACFVVLKASSGRSTSTSAKRSSQDFRAVVGQQTPLTVCDGVETWSRERLSRSRRTASSTVIGKL